MQNTPTHAARNAAALRMLSPGTRVGHANPELASWAGTVQANRSRRWARPETGDVWVVCDDDGKGHWYAAGALTIAGFCPGCLQPAHYVLPAAEVDSWSDRTPGWYHDEAGDQAACQGGAVPDPGHACHIGPARLRAYLASRDGIAFTAADVAVHMGWDEADAGGYLRIMAQDRRLGELAEQAGGTWLFRLAGGTRS